MPHESSTSEVYAATDLLSAGRRPGGGSVTKLIAAAPVLVEVEGDALELTLGGSGEAGPPL